MSSRRSLSKRSLSSDELSIIQRMPLLPPSTAPAAAERAASIVRPSPLSRGSGAGSGTSFSERRRAVGRSTSTDQIARGGAQRASIASSRSWRQQLHPQQQQQQQPLTASSSSGAMRRCGSEVSLDGLPRRGGGRRRLLDRHSNHVSSTSSSASMHISARSLSNSSFHSSCSSDSINSSADFWEADDEIDEYNHRPLLDKPPSTNSNGHAVLSNLRSRRSRFIATVLCVLALVCVGSVLLQNSTVEGPTAKRLAPRRGSKQRQKRQKPGKTAAASSSQATKLPAVAVAKPANEASTIANEASATRLDSSSRFAQNRNELQEYQQQHGFDAIFKPITAYTEPSLHDTVPGTGSRDNPDDKMFGTVPTFHIPLPRRTKATPDNLQQHIYPSARTCHDLPAKFPIDRGLQIDPRTGQTTVWNVGHDATPPDFPQTQASSCPVELDPFLPWIHDVVTSPDGTAVKFVAQNMRRCRTGPAHTDNVNRLVPQVTLMQAVSVQRINESLAQDLAPDMWTSVDEANSHQATHPRYRLAPTDEASDDGKETRFICRFHMMQVQNGQLTTVPIGETLSVFPFNYELLSYRKNQRSLLSPKGNDAGFFWSSSLQFECPVPDHAALRAAIVAGTTVLADGSPTIHVDIAPIRTSVRYSEVYLTEDQIGPNSELPLFDPVTRWGPNHVLPRFEASGRWANIPVCNPPARPSIASKSVEPANVPEKKGARRSKAVDASVSKAQVQKPHYLSACLWASAEFKQRGESNLKNTDTLNRLQEWIEFHLLAGFDHVYVYDNSGAHSNETTLEPITSQYPATQVTRIDWPSSVCNNNRPSDESPGERSSQYAAETSCRVRYGQYTEWIASFDTDEYFVPMGNYTNLKDVLRDAHDGGTNILSFRSSRGKLRQDHSESALNGAALQRAPSSTFLQAYNCDGGGVPKPKWADRAKKQIYRTDYVLHHFVHYSTATKGVMKTYSEAGSKKWIKRYREGEPSEIFTDEINQAVMVHTKSINAIATDKYQRKCRFDSKKHEECWVASPWPNAQVSSTNTYDKKTGLSYNCFMNGKVEDYWVPRVKDALAKRRASVK